MTTSQQTTGLRRRPSRLHLLAALSAAAVLTAGVLGVLNLAPVPAVADAPISTITSIPSGSVLAAPAADVSVARAAGERVKEVAAERESATREPVLTCEPSANARLVGNIIVNKNCPDLIAAKEAAQGEYLTSGDAQRDWGCRQGYITDGCGSVNGRKPTEAQQRQNIADGSVPVGGGYTPGSGEYDTCVQNPVADVCGG